MSTVYIAIRLIVPVGHPEQVLDVLEFEGATWMDALDAAYAWLKQHRKPTCTYHVYC